MELFNGHLDRSKIRELASSLFQPPAVDEYFICGPGDMNEQVSAALLELGVAPEKIHSERFTVSGVPEAAPVVVEVGATREQADGNHGDGVDGRSPALIRNAARR